MSKPLDDFERKMEQWDIWIDDGLKDVFHELVRLHKEFTLDRDLRSKEL